MTLADEIGYEMRPGNRIQRVTQAIGSTRPGAWCFAKVLPPLDRRLFSLTEGRLTAPGLLAGLPVLTVTTIGAKSGRERVTPLMSVPCGNGLALIGSNFGQPKTPDWVFNLRANPRGRISYRDRTADFVARSASEDEWGATLTEAAKVYAGYAKYRERVTDRSIEVFVLDSAG